MGLPADVEVISVDDHVVEPPDLWQDRLPAQWRDLGPRVEEDTTSEPGRRKLEWVWEDRRYPMYMMGSRTTRRFRGDGTGSDFIAHSYDELEPGAYEVGARLAAMDEDGIHAQLVFPTFPRFAGTRFLDVVDKDAGVAVVRAWNDWMLDEWCAAAPGRFIPLSLLPLWDVAECVREIERCAAKGTKSISFPESPSPLGSRRTGRERGTRCSRRRRMPVCRSRCTWGRRDSCRRRRPMRPTR